MLDSSDDDDGNGNDVNDDDDIDHSEDSYDYNDQVDNATVRTIATTHRSTLGRNRDTSDEHTAAVRYLESKGIALGDNETSSKWVEMANRMKTVEDNLKERARLKSLLDNDSDSDEYSEADDESSSDDDVDDAEALEAYRFLEANGVELSDEADLMECIELAKSMMKEASSSSSSQPSW